MDAKGRQQLTELVEEEGGKNWWVPDAFLIHVLPHLPTELTVINPPPTYKANYNCFVYAFGIHGDKAFLGGNNPVQQEFVKHLLNKGVLKITELPESGDLVFYRDDSGNITHGGILKTSDTVVSKWMWGPIIENKLWDVPSSFGSKIFYVKHVYVDEIKKEYGKYGNSGVKIKPIS